MVTHSIIAINRDRQGFLSSPHATMRYLKMLTNKPIARFFALLAIAYSLLLTGDYFDFIELTQQALHFTGQTLANSTEPQRMARGG